MAIDLWDKVCEQIERDVRDPLNDLTPLYTMLQQVPKDVLIAYLPESELIRYEVLDAQGKRVALCNSRQLAESYLNTTPSSKIVEIRG